MQKVFSWDFSEPKGDDDDRRIMSALSTGTDNDTLRQSSSNERKQRDSEGNHALDYDAEEGEDDDDDKEDDEGDNVKEDHGNEKIVNDPGGKDAPRAEMRIEESGEGESFDDDDDDDRRSSACSEAINREGDFSGGLPPDLLLLLPTKYSTLDRNFKLHSKAESLVEALEKQRRQTVGNRLKELQTAATMTTTTRARPMTPSSSSSSNSASREMPIIARRSPSNDTVLLPKRTSQQRRSLNYESVIVASPFFSKSSKSSAPLRRLPGNERRHSATTGQRETEDPRRMEPYSNSPRRCLPKVDGDRGHFFRPSTGNAVLRGAAAAAAQSLNSQSSSPTEIAGKSLDDATPRQRTGHQGRVSNGNERERFLGGEEAKEKESVRNTDRFTESDNGTGMSSSVTALPRFPFSSNEALSFGRIASISLPPSPDDLGISHSTRHSSDDRTRGPASRDTDKSLLRSNVGTTKGPACISKIRDSLTDTVLTDDTTLPSKADTPNEDEIKYKASGDDDDFIQKTNSACRVETKKYHSDIRIKLKEAGPLFPVSYRSREVTQKSNGDVPGVSSSSSSSSEEREAEEESEIAEHVTPNWSSYPGPLPDAPTAHESEDEEAIDAFGRNVSAMEADVICTDADAKAKYDKLSSNADYFVGEISTSSTKAADGQTSRTNTKDFDPERCSYVRLNAAADHERSVRSAKNLQPSAVFASNNNHKTTSKNKITNHKSACDGSPRRSAERREAYLIESRSVISSRTSTTRESKSSGASSNNLPGRSADDDGICAKRSSTPQNNEPPPTTSRGRQDSSTGTVGKLFPEQENARTATDRSQKQSTGAICRFIGDEANMRWESKVTRKIDDQKRGERFKSSSNNSSSSRSPVKTASIERIWQSIEEPRPPRLLLRTIRRFEPEPGSPSSADKSSSSRRRRSSSRTFSSGDGGAVDVVDAVPKENGVHRQNTLREEKDEYSLLEIEVPKGGLGLGFCIDGGKDGPYGDRPITVKRLFRGSSDPTPSAAHAKLCPGDEIVSANGRNMTLLSRYVAWNYLKTLPEGTIKLVVRRQH